MTRHRLFDRPRPSLRSTRATARVRRRPIAPGGRVAAVVALAGLVLAGTAACGGGAGDDDPTEEPTVAASETPAGEETPEPEETPAGEETPEETGVVLSADGVGGVSMGTPDPRAALEALLGPAEREVADVACGPGDVDSLGWGALSVSTLEGALWGWDVEPRRGALPAVVTVESGVTPYQPLADALALPGATAPSYLESMDLLYVEADGVQYYGSGSDAAAAEIQLVGVNVVMCS